LELFLEQAGPYRAEVDPQQVGIYPPERRLPGA
jgi:hypothetical protein